MKLLASLLVSSLGVVISVASNTRPFPPSRPLAPRSLRAVGFILLPPLSSPSSPRSPSVSVSDGGITSLEAVPKKKTSRSRRDKRRKQWYKLPTMARNKGWIEPDTKSNIEPGWLVAPPAQ
ncbi:unnamed protein product [Vitrella brassicaformis CCMP3155]|uniref:Uncharacterized protein n=1 Tax=Vitrella brassicaformis (strain CCMP3155) TaxID=1169540 RepID=A0A0G4FAC4_VITBC|nr:unnamed protein product [Vitrella brassicaformis CCMP3155]|eukprot:CEM09290.1 unnamed protein product [Vitrella brassicaformis CCMP3155]